MFLIVRICMCNYTKVFVRHPSSVHGKPWWCTNALGSGIYQELAYSVWCRCLWIHESAWYASTGYSGVYMYIALFFVRICLSNLSLYINVQSFALIFDFYQTIMSQMKHWTKFFLLKVSLYILLIFVSFSSNIQALSYKANS